MDLSLTKLGRTVARARSSSCSLTLLLSLSNQMLFTSACSFNPRLCRRVNMNLNATCDWPRWCRLWSWRWTCPNRAFWLDSHSWCETNASLAKVLLEASLTNAATMMFGNAGGMRWGHNPLFELGKYAPEVMIPRMMVVTVTSPQFSKEFSLACARQSSHIL